MEREILVHELKTWLEFFKGVAKGDKDFEIRRDDRDFRVGDILWLREWDPATRTYSGRELHRQIKYMTERGNPWVKEGFVVLGLRAVSDPPRESCMPDSKPRYRMTDTEPRYRMTDTDWYCLIHAASFPVSGTGRRHDIDRSRFAKEINTTIFMAEESLRKAIATDLRSLGSSHPELASWAETLACRYARGEEAA